MFLLDTCVISQIAPGRSPADQSLRDWLRGNGDRCYLSVVTLSEIAYGIAWLRHRGASARSDRLAAWRDEVLAFHADRILPLDTPIASRAGELMAVSRAAGFAPNAEDAWIAATGEFHGFEVLTFNLSDFRPMGIACREPPRVDPQP